MQKLILILIGGLLLNSCTSISKKDNSNLENKNLNMENPSKSDIEKNNLFDFRKMTKDDNIILEKFYTKRNLFDEYIEENKLKNIFTCPGCGYPTISARSEYEICIVCNWEDDGQDEKDANDFLAGPNQGLSLTENRIIIGKTLLNIADNLKGVINDNPIEVLNAFELHYKRMNAFDDDKLMNALIDDPIWNEWKKQKKVVLTDLIKK